MLILKYKEKNPLNFQVKEWLFQEIVPAALEGARIRRLFWTVQKCQNVMDLCVLEKTRNYSFQIATQEISTHNHFNLALIFFRIWMKVKEKIALNSDGMLEMYLGRTRFEFVVGKKSENCNS